MPIKFGGGDRNSTSLLPGYSAPDLAGDPLAHLATSDSNAFVDFVKGVGSGVARDPILGLAMSALPNVDQRDIEELRHLGGDGAAAQVGRLVGELGTLLVPALGVFGVGQRLGTKGAQLAGRALGTVGATQLRSGAKGFQVGVGATARSRERLGQAGFISEMRDRLPQLVERTPEGEFVRPLTLRTALKRGELTQDEFNRLRFMGFEAGRPLRGRTALEGLGGTGAIERTSQILAANGLLGGFEGGREAARAIYEGEDFDEAIRMAALVTVLGLGFEGGLTFLGRTTRINADLGLLNLLPVEARRAIGAKVFGSADALVNRAGQTQVPGIRNRLDFGRPTPSQPQVLRAQRKFRKATTGFRDARDEAKTVANDTLTKLNRLLLSPVVSIAPGRSTRSAASPAVTLAEVLDPAKFDDFVGARGISFTGLAKDTRRAKAKLEVLFKQTREAKDREKFWDDLLHSDPLTAYFDDTPMSTSDISLSISQRLLDFIVTPEGIAKRLGITGSRAVRGMRAVESKNIQARDAAQVTGDNFRKEFLQTLGLSARQYAKMVRGDPTQDLGIRAMGVMEVNGANHAQAVVEMRRVMGVDADKAERLVGMFERMQDVMNNGFKAPFQLTKGGPTITHEALVGFSQLTSRARKLHPISPQALRSKMRSADAMWFPHTLLNMPRAKLEEMMQRRMTQQEWARYLQTRSHRRGLPNFPSLDYQRVLPGPLAEKVGKGLPFERDIFKAHSRYMYEVNRRYNTGRAYGFDDKTVDATIGRITRAIGAENAINFASQGRKVPATPPSQITTMMKNMMDVMVHRKWEEEAERSLANILVNWNIASKLTFAVIPNMTQISQTLAFNGFRNTIKGFRDVTTGVNRDLLNAGVVNSQGILDGRAFAFGDRPFPEAGITATIGNTMEALSNAVLTGTGFRHVEGFNRRLGGMSAFHRSVELITKNARLTSDGRQLLRGTQLERARAWTKNVGFDLDEVTAKVVQAGVVPTPTGSVIPGFPKVQNVARWFQTQEGLDWVVATMFEGARKTQFIPHAAARPLLWNYPVGRVISQFKTFGLQQARFIRDSVAREVALGNYVPAMTYLGIAPVAGELAGDARQLITKGVVDRPSNAFERFISNMSYVGGMGIIGDFMRAGRFEQGLEFLAGPTVSDMVGLAEQFTRWNIDGVFRDLGRLPGSIAARRLWQLLGAGVGPSVEWLDEQVSVMGDSTEGPQGTITTFDLQRNATQQKSRGLRLR